MRMTQGTPGKGSGTAPLKREPIRHEGVSQQSHRGGDFQAKGGAWTAAGQMWVSWTHRPGQMSSLQPSESSGEPPGLSEAQCSHLQNESYSVDSEERDGESNGGDAAVW